MANTNAAFGLRPYNLVGSATNSTGYTRYAIQTVAVAGTTSSLFTGQVVIPLSTGLIDAAGNANGGTVPLLGVFMGCEYIDLNHILEEQQFLRTVTLLHMFLMIQIRSMKLIAMQQRH